MNVEVRENGEFIVVKTPYLPVFVEEFKKMIPRTERKFENGAWHVKNTPENAKIVRRLVGKYFEELKEALLVAVADGRPPTIGGLSIISYGRDYYSPKSSEFFHVVEAVRVGSTGSKKHPLWSGYVLAIVKINKNIPVEADYYRLFEKSVDNVETLREFVRGLGEKYGDDIEKAVVEIENLDVKEIALNGGFGNIFDPLDEVLEEVQKIIADGNVKGAQKLLERLKKELNRRLRFVENLEKLF